MCWELSWKVRYSRPVPVNGREPGACWSASRPLPWADPWPLIRADAGFAGADGEAQVQDRFGWPVEIIQKPKDQLGFAVLPRRWVIEQTFGCGGRYRRLSKDYAQNPSCSRARLLLTAIR